MGRIGGTTYHKTLTERVDFALERAAAWVDEQAENVASSGVGAMREGNNFLGGYQAFMYTPTKTLANVVNGFINLPRLATSDDMAPNLAYALTHLSQTVNHILKAIRSNSLQDNTALALSIVGAGEIAGVAGRAGDAAGTAAKTSINWVAPKAGQMFENYMARTGALAYVVDRGLAPLKTLDNLSDVAPKVLTNPADIRAAAQSWSSEMKAKFDLADKFYSDARFVDYDSHLRGIDFTKPVEVVDFG